MPALNSMKMKEITQKTAMLNNEQHNITSKTTQSTYCIHRTPSTTQRDGWIFYVSLSHIESTLCATAQRMNSSQEKERVNTLQTNTHTQTAHTHKRTHSKCIIDEQRKEEKKKHKKVSQRMEKVLAVALPHTLAHRINSFSRMNSMNEWHWVENSKCIWDFSTCS